LTVLASAPLIRATRRVSVDMSNFASRVPQSVRDAGIEADWNNTIGKISAVYNELRETGIPTQDARSVLPANVLTNVICKMNLRTLARLVGERAKQDDEHHSVIRAMTEAALQVHPWAATFLP
jgi:thymidylate synthase (FAD)